ncbi:MAG: phosphatase PAP2 family protein [Candidatus Doudnabacteria bacterium]|nr:phosphatase PAP2 family protein [Candidatus Doudnabacteria bacterium]
MRKTQYEKTQAYLTGHAWLIPLLDFFSTKVTYLYMASAVLFLWTPLGRQVGYSLAISLCVAWGICTQACAYVFPLRRPYQKYGFTPLAGRGMFSRVDADYDSFPSGHTVALAVVTIFLFVVSLPLGLSSLLVLGLSALSRVVLGYHYMVDITAGILLGTLVVSTLHMIGLYAYIVTVIP